MNIEAPRPVHIVRANALEYEGIWRLGSDAFEVEGGPTASSDTIVRFPYREVAEVRLSFAPSRVDRLRYRCDVRMRSGQRVAIFSTHYAGVMDFEDRAATYVPFVSGLIARVAAANPSAKFRSGKRPLVYWAEHIFLLAMVILLVFVLSLTGLAYVSESSWARFAIIAFFIPLLIAYARKNRPRRFGPDTIPDDVLPEAIA